MKLRKYTSWMAWSRKSLLSLMRLTQTSRLSERSLHWLGHQKQVGKSTLFEFLVDFELVFDDAGVALDVGNDVHGHLDPHLVGQLAGLVDDFGEVSSGPGGVDEGREEVRPVLSENLHQPGVLRVEVGVNLNVW